MDHADGGGERGIVGSPGFGFVDRTRGLQVAASFAGRGGGPDFLGEAAHLRPLLVGGARGG